MHRAVRIVWSLTAVKLVTGDVASVPPLRSVAAGVRTTRCGTDAWAHADVLRISLGLILFSAKP